MKRTGSLELIKNINRALVLEQIRENKSITRAQIAKKLNLSRSTVSLITDDLIHKKFVTELGYGDSTSEGGRRGITLGFNPSSSYGVGVDIGGTKIFVVITDLDGNVMFKESMNTSSQIPEIIKMIQECIIRSQIDSERIIAMGIGLPGTIDMNTGILIDAPALGLKDVKMKQEFGNHFPFPLFFNNDVNCAALGERWLGTGDNADDFVFIAIGTGLGSAIIANGELVVGNNFSSGEIGYFVTPSEVRNNIINLPEEFGTLENKISGTALSKHGFSSEELFNQSNKGNLEAAAMVEEFVIEISTAIANIVSLLNPQKVIIGGGVSESLGCILASIKRKVDHSTPIKTDIELAQLGGDAGGIGAIAYAFQQLQQQNE